MKRLPLYEGQLPTLSLVEEQVPADRDQWPPAGRAGAGRACKLCDLGERNVHTPCIAADGSPGGLLVVGEAPGRDEDLSGRPFVGMAGKHLRRAIAKHWSGPVAYDSAVRCFPPRNGLKEKHAKKCRPYLTSTIAEVAPTRIIAVGAWAAYSLFGRSIAPLTTRRAYNWVRGAGALVPVFMCIPPASALRNRFVDQWFQADLAWALTAVPEHGPWRNDVRLVETYDDAVEAAEELLEHRWVAFDVEARGVMWESSYAIISVSLVGSEDVDAPWVWSEAALQNERARAVLLGLLTNKYLPKVGSNVKYDQLAFRAQYGIKVGPVIGDTRLERKLLDPEASGALGHMAELVGMGGMKEEAHDFMAKTMGQLKRNLKKESFVGPLAEGVDIAPSVEAAMRLGADPDEYKFEFMPKPLLHRYNARDAVATGRLKLRLEAEIEGKPDLKRTWDTLVLPAANALERVEAWGVGANKKAIGQFDTYLAAKEAQASVALQAYPDVNWGSWQQVGKLLFDRLGLPVIKLTESGGRSTDDEVLLALADKHPLPKSLLEWRSVTKMRGTYAQGMYPHVRSDGRIHPNVKLDGARSGRTSCTDPNLQNIPRAADSYEGKMARDVFCAPPGYLLLEADYSQLELRVAAMLSGDERMRDIFTTVGPAGEYADYHQRTAQMVAKVAWGVDDWDSLPKDLKKTYRTRAKNINFGVLYGKTTGSLAEEWGISKVEAQKIVDAVMGNFKQLARWCRERQTEAAKTGQVWTWWAGKPARHRPLYRIADQGQGDAGAVITARNGAVNSPVQGTASDFCIASLVECIRWLEVDRVPNVKLVLPVHDALMFEVREDMVDEVAGQVNEIMTGWESNGVPLVADFKVGPSWGSMDDYKVAA